MPGSGDRDEDDDDRDGGSGDPLPDEEEGDGDRHDEGAGRDDGPPERDDRDGGDDDDPPDSDPDPPVEREVPVDGEDPAAPPIDRAVVVRFLCARDAPRIAARAVRKIVPREVVEDLAAEAIERALRAPPPRSERALPSWLSTIAVRRGIRWLETRRRRSKLEGPMPEHRAKEDDYTGEIVDADLEPGELAYDPEQDAALPQLLGSSLDHCIGDDPHDLETREIIREHAYSRKTYKQIAVERNTTEAALKMRISRFKKKYAERVRRRDQMFLWLKLGGSALVLGVVAALLYYFLHLPKTALIGPDPDVGRPAPSASVTGPDIAAPTQPSASASSPIFAPPNPPDGKK